MVEHKLCQRCQRSIIDRCFRPVGKVISGQEASEMLNQEEVRKSDTECQYFKKITLWYALKRFVRQKIYNAEMRKIEKVERSETQNFSGAKFGCIEGDTVVTDLKEEAYMNINGEVHRGKKIEIKGKDVFVDGKKVESKLGEQNNVSSDSSITIRS